MQMTFRWYGKDDPIPLKHIAQIPCISGIVSALYDPPVGQLWPKDKLMELSRCISEAGLGFEVVESLPVHEHIKLGLSDRDKLIESYIKNLQTLSECGIKVLCYNFMPVFDWTRTRLDNPLKDGSLALSYDQDEIKAIDPQNKSLSLPGWDESYTRDELLGLMDQYQRLGKDGLWENLEYFLKAVVPAAKKYGICLAIHPDDPPWDIFGLPRIITGGDSIRRLLSIVNERENGITFCTGSLGPDTDNNLIELAGELAPRIHFAHLRNIKITGNRKFTECGHCDPEGSLDLKGIIKSLKRGGFDGYIRPDHGRAIWGESGRPGYWLYDRALGACYLYGLWQAS